MFTEKLPPLAPLEKDAEEGDKLIVHGMPACAMENVWLEAPATETVMKPVRAKVLVLGPTVKATGELVARVMVIQE